MARGQVPLGVRLDGGPIRLAKDRTLPVELTLETENVDLKPITKAFRMTPLTGAVSIVASVSGTIGRPRGGVVAIVTGFSGMGVRPIDVVAALEADNESAKASLAVEQGCDRIALAYLGGPVEVVDGLVRGVPPEILLNSFATKGRIELERLRFSDILEEDLVAEFGDMEAEATLVMRGTLPQLAVTGKLEILGVPSGKDRLDVSVGLDYEEGVTSIDGAVTEGGESLAKLLGTIPGPLGAWFLGGDVMALIRDPNLSLTLELDGANPDALKAVAPDVVKQLEDTFDRPVLRGRVTVAGTAKGPEIVADAKVETGSGADPNALFDSATVWVRIGPNESVAEVTVSQTVPASVPEGEKGPGTTMPGEAIFARVETALGTSHAFAASRRPLLGLPLVGYVRSAGFDLSRLHALMPTVLDRSPGKFYADLAITGTVGKPVMEGAIRAQFERLRVLTIGLDQPNADVTLRLRGQDLTLWPKVVFVQGGRRFEIELGARFESLTPSGITLSGSLDFDRFPILRRQDIAMVLSGRIDLAGTLARPSVKGKLHVNDLQVRVLGGDRDVRPLGPPAEVVFARGWNPPVALQKSDSFTSQVGEKVELDISIAVPARGVRLRSDEIDVWAEGDIRVRTGALGVVLLGRLVIDEGNVSLYGREFRLEPESAVIFDGDDAIDPLLDLRAKFSLADVDLSGIGHTNSPGNHILLSIGGRSSKPRLVFSSVPALPETDIIAIVTVGGPTNDSKPGSSNTGKVASALMGFVSSSASRMLQDRLPVDVLKVEAGSEDLSKAKITVGKRLMSNLVLSYNANFGAQPGENRNEVGLQYDVTRRLQLDTRYGDAGAGGIDMLYLWRF